METKKEEKKEEEKKESEELSHGSASEETDKEEDEEEKNPFPLPDRVGYEESLRDKDGVYKKMLEVGTGAEKPIEPALITVEYKGYFTKTKEVFDSSEGKTVQLELGDPTFVEGFKIGVETMRRGERSEFRIKSKFAFRNPAPQLRIPTAYKGKEELIKRKGVTYEIKLFDFQRRVDVNLDKLLLKTVLRKGKGFRQPKDLDEAKSTFPD